jgi:hypothetical protein
VCVLKASPCTVYGLVGRHSERERAEHKSSKTPAARTPPAPRPPPPRFLRSLAGKKHTRSITAPDTSA